MNSLRLATLVAAVSLACATNAFAADAAVSPMTPVGATAVPGGLDRAGMDPAVRPQDDLFAAMNGHWLQQTQIPADKSEFGTFIELRDLSDERVKGLVEKLAAAPQAAGSNEARIADYYAGYLDTAAIDKAGLAPLKPWTDQLDAVATRAELVELLGRWQAYVDVPLALQVQPDAKDPHVYAPQAAQGGLGLPDRDYYLKKDAAFAKARAAYAVYVRQLLTLDGDPQAASHAAAVIALERKLAAAQWSQEALRDPVKAYNPMTLAQLSAKAPGVDWKAFVDAGETPVPATLTVLQPAYATAFARLVAHEPLDTWKQYLRVRLLDARAHVLPAGFREASFAFHGAAIQGLKEDRARWQQGVDSVNGALGEAVGQLYVAQYFPPAHKARMLELVNNLLAAYAGSIDGLTWMSPQTKAAAHEKLAKYAVKIGYPDHWRDYSALEIRAGDPFGNAMRASHFDYLRQAVRSGKPVDRGEWDLLPQTVNADYDPNKNAITFPAAILQPPFFDMQADDAVNYGAIGAIIGHEISHGFDDEGSQYDGDGRLRNWWTAADRRAFAGITARLVAQFAAYQPLPGQHLNGKLTLGENIADLSGLQIAYKAYKLSLGGKEPAPVDGLSGEQRFYLGWSQAWREKVRDDRALQLVTIDPHSPTRFRADGAAMNADGFHEAFGTKPGDRMWKAPADRIRLW
ncbi:MAG: M13 family metallopeptidase [Burkholderiaceae bacterium]